MELGFKMELGFLDKIWVYYNENVNIHIDRSKYHGFRDKIRFTIVVFATNYREINVKSIGNEIMDHTKLTEYFKYLKLFMDNLNVLLGILGQSKPFVTEQECLIESSGIIA